MPRVCHVRMVSRLGCDLCGLRGHVETQCGLRVHERGQCKMTNGLWLICMPQIQLRHLLNNRAHSLLTSSTASVPLTRITAGRPTQLTAPALFVLDQSRDGTTNFTCVKIKNIRLPASVVGTPFPLAYLDLRMSM
jgi:hypothetical protein